MLDVAVVGHVEHERGEKLASMIECWLGASRRKWT